MILDKVEVVGARNPIDEANLIQRTNEEIGVVFDVVDIILIGLKLTGLDLSTLGWRGLDDMVGEGGIGFGKIENFVVGRIKFNKLGRIGRNNCFKFFRKTIDFGSDSCSFLIFPIFSNEIEVESDIGKRFLSNGLIEIN